MLIAKFFMKFKENKNVKGCMTGLKPCVIGLIASVVISMFITVFIPIDIKNIEFNKTIISIIILISSLILINKKIHPIIIIFISAIIGIISGILLF